MNNLEHYFENLLFTGKDVNGDLNKNLLTKEEQNAVEVCANYVLFTLFCGRDELKKFLEFPKVDAEPIVRCKDCRWGRKTCGNVECRVDLNAPPEYHGYDWFCPNGER